MGCAAQSCDLDLIKLTVPVHIIQDIGRCCDVMSYAYYHGFLWIKDAHPYLSHGGFLIGFWKTHAGYLDNICNFHSQKIKHPGVERLGFKVPCRPFLPCICSSDELCELLFHIIKHGQEIANGFRLYTHYGLGKRGFQVAWSHIYWMVLSVFFNKIMKKMPAMCRVACRSHNTGHKGLSCRLSFKVNTTCSLFVACEVAFTICAVIAHIACGRVNRVIPVKDAVVPVPKADNLRSWCGAFNHGFLFLDLTYIYLDVLQSFNYKTSFF